ncbi:MAG: hypothetical protein R3185_06555 [Candidatus Thermoplasmatota archaeon]|nr:hypothetical protein [Candidatus Thermoplasmatota archaeon]
MAYDLDANGTGCALAVAVVLVPMDRAADVLPMGFEPRDASGLVGADVGAGRAAVLLDAVRCEDFDLSEGSYDVGEVSILVEAPDVPGERAQADADYYRFAVHTTDPELVATFEQAGWNVVPGRSRLEITGAADRPLLGQATVQANGRLAFEMSIRAAATTPYQGLHRFWHASTEGTGHLDVTFDAEAVAGQASCTIASASSAALVTGFSSCPADTPGVLVQAGGWEGRFFHYPGVRPGA